MMYLANQNKHIILLWVAVSLVACKANETPEAAKTYPTPYTLEVPRGFPNPKLSTTNPLTVEGIELGKRLYNDDILSTNGRSCTSCHQPINSYSSPLFTSWSGITYSVPPHINLGFKSSFNWDGSQNSLDTLGMGDFEPEFFNTDPVLLFKRLSEHPIYSDLFKKAYNIANVNDLTYHELKKKIAMAIAQYLRSRVSANSKFDQFRRREVLLDNLEYEGYVIFFSEKGDCFHCHTEPLFTDQQFHNNGVSNTYTGFNRGRFAITGKDADMGKFLTPTLRNISLTAPYMHDGRFKTLEEVVDFYDSGVHANGYVDPLMTKTNGERELLLTPLQKLQLIAFLKTLTDIGYTQ